MDKVLILMSIHNGEKYLRFQLDSILKQRAVLIDILIRDDGSNDGSEDIIKEYINKYSNIFMYKGSNIGAAMSFIDLIYKARDLNNVYDYYAFSDQDDVWLENKIFTAVKKIKELKKIDINILYSSSYTLVDKNLKILYDKKTIKYSKFEYFLRNNLPGCTMVFNRKLLETMAYYKPTYVEMHDSWILRVLLITNGSLIIDDNSFILYRQHEDNLIGAKKSIYKKFIKRLEISFSRRHVTSQTSSELLKGFYKFMSEEDIDLCFKFKNCKSIKNKITLINMCIKVRFSTFGRKILYILDVIVGNI